MRYPIDFRRAFLFTCVLFLLLSSLCIPVYAQDEIPEDFTVYALQQDGLFQASTIGALMAGIYDGEVTFESLKKYGDFGIGTVNGLDGEMIGLDGEFFQIKSDGVAYPITDEQMTPFANVTPFLPEVSYFDVDGLTYEQLKKRLDDMVPTPNYVYAFKISGTFSSVQTRSVPKQEKPYVPLTEAVKNQTVFDFTDVEGTMVGFYCPSYVNGINVPGYHFHFITKDRKAGGHVLDCSVGLVDVEIDYKYGFSMVLPMSGDFYNADLSVEGLDDVEKPKSSLRYFQHLK